MLTTFTHQSRAVSLLMLAAALLAVAVMVLNATRGHSGGRSDTGVVTSSGRVTPGSTAAARHAYRVQLGR